MPRSVKPPEPPPEPIEGASSGPPYVVNPPAFCKFKPPKADYVDRMICAFVCASPDCAHGRHWGRKSAEEVRLRRVRYDGAGEKPPAEALAAAAEVEAAGTVRERRRKRRGRKP